MPISDITIKNLKPRDKPVKVSDFADVLLRVVTAPMVLACLRKVEAKGNHETAQRLRSKISAVFRFAIASGVVDFDPAQALSDSLITSHHGSVACGLVAHE